MATSAADLGQTKTRRATMTYIIVSYHFYTSTHTYTHQHHPMPFTSSTVNRMIDQKSTPLATKEIIMINQSAVAQMDDTCNLPPEHSHNGTVTVEKHQHLSILIKKKKKKKWVPHGIEVERWLCNLRVSGSNPGNLEKVVYLDENSWTHTKS
jgi:hypothetical protein